MFVSELSDYVMIPAVPRLKVHSSAEQGIITINVRFVGSHTDNLNISIKST